MLDKIYKETEKKMKTAIECLKREFATLRTGRASISLVEGVKIEYYGTLTPLNQLATLSTPEPNLILVQPWDKSLLSKIEKAILQSDLGLNPVNDGSVIKIPIPPLTEERRKELIKVAGKIAENYRISIRNDRREANDKIKSLQKEKKISEDDSKRALDKIQKLTNNYIKQIDQLLKRKEEEILTS